MMYMCSLFPRAIGVIDKESLLTRIYEAFNRRDVNSVLSTMHPEIDWPNGWEGGRVLGRDAVGSYWTRQWAAINPIVVPIGFQHEADGRVLVRVNQVIKDLAGRLLMEGDVVHVYSFEEDKIKAMHILDAK
jgi:hypothetical protein